MPNDLIRVLNGSQHIATIARQPLTRERRRPTVRFKARYYRLHQDEQGSFIDLQYVAPKGPTPRKKANV